MHVQRAKNNKCTRRNAAYMSRETQRVEGEMTLADRNVIQVTQLNFIRENVARRLKYTHDKKQ